MELIYSTLKQRHRELRDDLPDSLALRTHRALSWLKRAEQEPKDADARFIFLWIAFNAAYANQIDDRQRFTERRVLLNFLQRLTESDDERLLYQIIWSEFPTSIRMLIDNKYVHAPFWEFANGNLSEADWLAAFQRSKQAANKALGRMDTKKILAIIFERLYVLRNQLIHGGATWNGALNREQMRDGANLMTRLVPTIIHLMLMQPDKLWGDPAYRVIDGT
jgi:hypothetical protein